MGGPLDACRLALPMLSALEVALLLIGLLGSLMSASWLISPYVSVDGVAAFLVSEGLWNLTNQSSSWTDPTP